MPIFGSRVLLLLAGGAAALVPAAAPRADLRCSAAALSAEQVAFANEAAPSLMSAAVLEYSAVGALIRRANQVSGGSAKVSSARLLEATKAGLRLECVVERTPLFQRKTEDVEVAEIEWPDEAPAKPVEERLLDLACRLKLADEAAQLLAIPGGPGDTGALAENMWLNNVPATREARSFFQRQAIEAIAGAVVSEKKRFSMTLRPPELDDEVDTYRVGTLLELARAVALSLVSRLGLRVRLCVQGPMGSGTFQGVPLSLNGVRRLLEQMDWGENTEELFARKYVRFGDATPASVDDDDDVFIVLAPQSLVGCSIVDSLQEMCAAIGDDRPVILVNPRLQDVASPQGVMGVRGRAGRLEFAESFDEIYKFRLVVPRGRAFFPILGALVKAGKDKPYVVYKRTERGKDGEPDPTFADSAAKFRAVKAGDLTESYVPIAAFLSLPDDSMIAKALRDYNAKLAAAAAAARPS